MSFSHLYAGRKHDHREAFTANPGKKEFLFIKSSSNNKNDNLKNLSLEALYKQLQITRSNLR